MIEQEISSSCTWGEGNDPCECLKPWVGREDCERKIFQALTPVITRTIIGIAMNKYYFNYATAMAVAEDGVGETYLRLFKKILKGGFEENRSTKAFVMGIARRVAYEACRDLIGKNKWHKHNGDDENEEDDAAEVDELTFDFDDEIRAVYPERWQLDEAMFTLLCKQAKLNEMEPKLLRLYTPLSENQVERGKPKLKAKDAARMLGITVKEVYKLNESIKEKLSKLNSN